MPIKKVLLQWDHCVSVFVSINGFCNNSFFQVLSGGPGEFIPVIESVVGFCLFCVLKTGSGPYYTTVQAALQPVILQPQQCQVWDYRHCHLAWLVGLFSVCLLPSCFAALRGQKVKLLLPPQPSRQASASSTFPAPLLSILQPHLYLLQVSPSLWTSSLPASPVEKPEVGSCPSIATLSALTHPRYVFSTSLDRIK